LRNCWFGRKGARHFFRAEIMSFADLIEIGSELAVKETGKFRTEGKSYVVQDGENMHVRFNL
jgi:ribosome-binding ATPase